MTKEKREQVWAAAYGAAFVAEVYRRTTFPKAAGGVAKQIDISEHAIWIADCAVKQQLEDRELEPFPLTKPIGSRAG
jgi:hypothetical protein